MTLSSTILIVDDTPAIHTMISALLRDEPYQLEHAYSGEEALVKAQDLAPDLILLDIMMPDIDGFEVCRRLRGASGVAEVPIIMLTALSDRASRLQGLAAGADDFVSKPFDQTELRIRIKTITRLDRYRRLLAERARFDRLVELAPDGVLIVAGDGRIRLANPAIVRLLGLEDEQTALGRRFVDFVSNSQRDRWLSFFARAEQAVGDSDIVESLLQRANGEQSPVEITAGAFEWDGKSVVQMLVRDITGRKLTEEALQKRNLELRRLAARLAEAQELERQNLARELHDLVFTIYGNLLGLPPESIPPLVLKAIILDTFLVIGFIVIKRRRKQIWAAVRKMLGWTEGGEDAMQVTSSAEAEYSRVS